MRCAARWPAQCGAPMRSQALNRLGALLNAHVVGRAGRHPDVPRHPPSDPEAYEATNFPRPQVRRLLGVLFCGDACLNMSINKIAEGRGFSATPRAKRRVLSATIGPGRRALPPLPSLFSISDVLSLATRRSK